MGKAGELIARLRESLGGVDCAAFRGDNLGIFLASEFEPGVESEELDESGTWKQGALDLADEVLDAIHSHYATLLASQESEIEALRKDQEKASDKPLTDIGWTVSELRKTDPRAEPKMARMFMIKAARLLVETEARALAAEARVAEAVERLKPFALIFAEANDLHYPDDRNAWGFNNYDLRWGDFRAARDFIARTQKDNPHAK